MIESLLIRLGKMLQEGALQLRGFQGTPNFESPSRYRLLIKLMSAYYHCMLYNKLPNCPAQFQVFTLPHCLEVEPMV